MMEHGNNLNQYSSSTPLSQPSSQSDRQKPKKLRRSTRACDFCHRRSIRCKPSTEPDRCQNCVDFDVPCTFDRPAKKRGVRAAGTTGDAGGSAALASEDKDGARHDAGLLLHLTHENVHAHNQALKNDGVLTGSFRVEPDNLVGFSLPKEHRDMVLSNHGMITNLVSVYFEVIYPIFPLFHRQKLLRIIASRDYLKDLALFAAIMSLCTLASARARDGALPPGMWDTAYFLQPSAESFFAAAKDVLSSDLGNLRGFNFMRSSELLALYGIQVGRTDIMHQYLGLYHSLVAMEGVHDEKNWPTDVGIVELEERRRLFWSTYTLEVYCSIVWGGVIRCRESQSRVVYPLEVDDEFFSDLGFGDRPLDHTTIATNLRMAPVSETNPSCWLHGWNRVTEMYRVLEHAMNEFERRRPQNIGLFTPSDLFLRDTPIQNVVLEKIDAMHSNLPPRFKEARNRSSDMREDIFSFQAANIAATLQLVRMVLFSTNDTTASQKSSIAGELLEGFSKVPMFFLRAISAPLLHHMAGIGSILGSVIEGPLSDTAYIRVRNALISMANLLSILESGITRSAGAADRIRSIIGRIDEYMAAQRQSDSMNMPPRQTVNSMGERSIRGQALVNHGQTAPVVTHSAMSHIPLDPALHHSLASQGHIQHQHWHRGAMFDDSLAGGTAGMMGGVEQPNNEMPVDWNEIRSNSNHFQFQVPPEVLEDWPWSFDASQGSGAFGQ